MRTSKIVRKTAETDIQLTLNLDGKGESNIKTGSGFLDHMLTLFSKHSRFDLDVICAGDSWVDYHHTAEDIGIALGKAFFEAIGDKKGICRYADTTLPMDESLIMSAVDISGRAYLSYNATTPTTKVGEFDTELSEEFWQGFVREAGVTLHVTKLAGTNSHHIIEGVFKSVARTLNKATAIDLKLNGEIPSTKGVL
ncbi:MAG: imidazoleglycerol-phosphate dehydratase HisB [Ruminococcaceae bacterium]|nr:imidazoleglycerol-phosphate dehydratase HisB [Oscillospiraceae bacterium]